MNREILERENQMYYVQMLRQFHELYMRYEEEERQLEDEKRQWEQLAKDGQYVGYRPSEIRARLLVIHGVRLAIKNKMEKFERIVEAS